MPAVYKSTSAAVVKAVTLYVYALSSIYLELAARDVLKKMSREITIAIYNYKQHSELKHIIKHIFEICTFSIDDINQKKSIFIMRF